jgi:hypothetical protein
VVYQLYGVKTHLAMELVEVQVEEVAYWPDGVVVMVIEEVEYQPDDVMVENVVMVMVAVVACYPYGVEAVEVSIELVVVEVVGMVKLEAYHDLVVAKVVVEVVVVKVEKVDAYHGRLIEAENAVACESHGDNLAEICPENDYVVEATGCVSNNAHQTTVGPENRISGGRCQCGRHLDDTCLLLVHHLHECLVSVVA